MDLRNNEPPRAKKRELRVQFAEEPSKDKEETDKPLFQRSDGETSRTHVPTLVSLSLRSLCGSPLLSPRLPSLLASPLP
eukprot:2704322-Rhodomonas_salina.2